MSSEMVMVKKEYEPDNSELCLVKVEIELMPSEPRDISNNVEFSSQGVPHVNEEAKSLNIKIKEEVECLAVEVKAEPVFEWESETLQPSRVWLPDPRLILENQEAGCSGSVWLKKEDDTDLQRIGTTAPNTAEDLFVPQMILVQDKQFNSEDGQVLDLSSSVKLEHLNAESQFRFQPNDTATTDQQKYFCDFCGSSFESKLLVLQHEKSEHNYVSYMCSQCDFKTDNKQTLQTHEAIHATKKLFHCGQCSFTSNFKSTLRNHQSVHISEKNWKCSYCDYKCSRKGNMRLHERIHNDARLICDHCGFAAIQKGNLARHIMTHSSLQPFQCSNCDFKCTAKRDLKIHQRIHTGEKPFKCSYCEFSCRLKQSLRLHIMKHTGETPYKCSHCDYVCQRERNLKRHESRHTTGEANGENTLFGCHVCSRKFNWKSDLQNHMTTHTAEKLFKCTYCDYSAKKKTYLTMHLLKHTGDNPYKCNHCDYASPIKKNLKRHELRHTTVKTSNKNTALFECDICSRKYKWKTDLRDHVKIHTGEKPFKCSHCDYSTHMKKYLKEHETRHATREAKDKNIKQFGCTICSRKYKWKTDLRKHMKIHSGEKPLKCSHCNYTTHVKKNLKRHELKHAVN